jgi:hypothetical protein
MPSMAVPLFMPKIVKSNGAELPPFAVALAV